MNIKKFSTKALTELGNDIVEKVRKALFVGSSNINEDILKTGGWVHTLVNSQRTVMEWRKKAKGWEIADSTRGHAHVEDFSVDSLGRHALFAARAYMNKSGNCGELTDVTLYFLAKFFKDHDFKNENIKISRVSLPEPYDHTLIKITVNDGGADHTLYVDPWMGISYLERDYAKNIDLTIQKLIQEMETLQNDSGLGIDILGEMRDQNNVENAKNPTFLLIGETINSSADCNYFVKLFETAYQHESGYTHEVSKYFSDELTEALKNRDFKLVSTYLDRGARIDDWMLAMSFLQENAPIKDKIQSQFLKNYELKLIYFRRLLRSVEKSPDIDTKINRIEELKTQINKYKISLEENKINILKILGTQKNNIVNDFFEKLKIGINSIEIDCESYIKVQKNIQASRENVVKPLERIVSDYKFILKKREKRVNKWKKLNHFLGFSRKLPSDESFRELSRKFQINFLKEMNKHIMLNMQTSSSETRLTVVDARLIVLGALFILKAQLKEKNQKGILGRSSLEDKIDKELGALLPPNSNIENPDPVAVTLCLKQMEKLSDDQVKAAGSSEDWDKLNETSRGLIGKYSQPKLSK